MSYVGGGWNLQSAQDFFVLPNVFLTTTCFLLFGLCSVLHGRGSGLESSTFMYLYWIQTEKQNWGRPWNEAIFPAVCFISSCFKFTLAHQVHNIPSLISRIPHSGAQTLKLCRCGEPGSFLTWAPSKEERGRKILIVSGHIQDSEHEKEQR